MNAVICRALVKVVVVRFTLALLLIYSPNARTQSQGSPEKAHSSTHTLAWGTLGVGVIAPGFGGLVRVAYSWDRISSLSVKREAASSIDFFNLPDEVTEWSMYYGRQYVNMLLMLRAAAGPAYFIRSKSADTFKRIGIGSEAEVMLKFKFIGIGIMFTYMYARDISQPGFTANFSIGILE
jgi:hypothetical protein